MAAFVPPPSPLLRIMRPLLRSGNSACGDVVATDAVPDLSLERSFQSKEREFGAVASTSTSVQPPSSSRLPAAPPKNRLLLQSGIHSVQMLSSATLLPPILKEKVLVGGKFLFSCLVLVSLFVPAFTCCRLCTIKKIGAVERLLIPPPLRSSSRREMR
jgi:hypothetical protein